jgi:hypothetical protein
VSIPHGQRHLDIDSVRVRWWGEHVNRRDDEQHCSRILLDGEHYNKKLQQFIFVF